jgi:putative transposase
MMAASKEKSPSASWPPCRRVACVLTQTHTSEDFQRLLSAEGITCSMSSRGDCWDNSAIESFLASLKKERVYRTIYRTRDEGRAGIFDYMEAFYNSRRRHSTLGQVSPNEFERSYAGLA